jgi:hypothetical protein
VFLMTTTKEEESKTMTETLASERVVLRVAQRVPSSVGRTPASLGQTNFGGATMRSVVDSHPWSFGRGGASIANLHFELGQGAALSL